MTTVLQMTEPRSIVDLFEEGVGGDEQAWAELVDRLSPAIWSVARQLGLSRELSEDVFQTVWMTLIDKHETINDPAALPLWVKRVAHNTAVSILRKENRIVASVDEQLHEPIETQPSPDDVIATWTTNALLRAALQQLAKTDARCALLLELLARAVPYTEIAVTTEMAVGSIGATRSRCLTKLRATDAMQSLIEAR